MGEKRKEQAQPRGTDQRTKESQEEEVLGNSWGRKKTFHGQGLVVGDGKITGLGGLAMVRGGRG